MLDSPLEPRQTMDDRRSSANDRDAENDIVQDPSPAGAAQTRETAETHNNSEMREPLEKHDARPKKSMLARAWSKTGLTLPTILFLLKSPVAPTIAIAMYQSEAIAEVYVTLGYLVAIATILAFPILPRAKFLQNIIITSFAICLGAAVNLLAIWTVIKAREHTTPAGAPPGGYNSSASAVSAIWLFFQVYLVNALRSARPQLQLPGIVYTIFCSVAMSYSPLFPTMAQGVVFAERLLEAFLTGFAISAGVSLFVVPISCRAIIFREFTGFLNSLRREVKAQTAYTASLENADMFTGADAVSQEKPEAKALKAAVAASRKLHGMITADMAFAKREFAYGKLGPEHLSALLDRMRAVLMPLNGMSSLVDIFYSVTQTDEWRETVVERHREGEIIAEWQGMMRALHEPFAEIGSAIDQGLLHVLLRLELQKPVKSRGAERDEEARAGNVTPGSEGFADWFSSKTDGFINEREVTLMKWCESKGITAPDRSLAENYEWIYEQFEARAKHRVENRRQLFVLLYMEYLLTCAARATVELVRYAETRHADGTMTRKRMIIPGRRRISKWFRTLLTSKNGEAGEDAGLSSFEVDTVVDLGEAYKKRKNPEHLPPRNSWERFGDTFRSIPNALRSPDSSFGLRVALATMTVSIVDYLKQTQDFFVRQRLVWAIIMIAISMTRTSGQSVFVLLLRVFGTFMAMVASYVIYYIVDGKTAGIIVFLYIWIGACIFFTIKHPKFGIGGIISAVTAILILGYELQTRKIGIAATEATFQPYYPIYELAPYRLATVAGGLAVAFIWTMIPFPISDHSELRRDLGDLLYILSNYYAVVHEGVRTRIRGDGGDPRIKNTPSHAIERANIKTAGKIMLLLGRLESSAEYSKWEVSVGGKFPTDIYKKLVDASEKVFQYTALISYASKAFELGHHEYGIGSILDSKKQRGTDGDGKAEGDLTTNSRQQDRNQGETQWHSDFRILLREVSTTSHDITSRLCLLSSSVANGNPLPPYLNDIEPFGLLHRLESIDRDILSIRHLSEPGYAAFAVMQIAATGITRDLNIITQQVKSLVGELDFSFHVMTSPADSSLAGSEASSIGESKGGVNVNGSKKANANANGKGKSE